MKLNRYTENLRIDGNSVYSYDTHVATIRGRELVKHGYWSVTTSKHINYVAKEYDLTVIDGSKEQPAEDPKSSSFINTVAMVAKMGELLAGPTDKARNDWKKRMIAAGLENKGISFPDDWDTLTEKEKKRRLDGAIKQLSEV